MSASTRYVTKLLLKEVGIAVVVGAVVWYLVGRWVHTFNYEALVGSMVALNSGIIIALFVALFQGDEENIQNFKKFKTASKQLYLIFLINSLLVCFSSLLVSNTPDSYVFQNYDWALLVTIIGATIAAVPSLVNVRFVYKLLRINYRTTE